MYIKVSVGVRLAYILITDGAELREEVAAQTGARMAAVTVGELVVTVGCVVDGCVG